MKKNKSIIIGLLILIIIYITFVVIDCIRLKNSVSYTKPFITIDEEITSNRTTYTGLGYSVSYYRDRQTVIDNDVVAIGGTGAYGAEFKLFNTILIWAWVE